MKNAILFIILSVLVTSAFAQPVIDKPMPGNYSYFALFVANNPPTPSTGANQTWDYSEVGQIMASGEIKPPVETPYAAQCPNANTVFEIDTNGVPMVYSYLRVSANSCEFMCDMKSTNQDAYINPETYLTLPMSYNDSFSDSYQKSSGSNVNFTATYVGYGTFKSIDQTVYPNVALIKKEYLEYNKWVFVTALQCVGTPEYATVPLYEIDELENMGIGYLWNVVNIPTAVAKTQPELKLNLYPNPATNQLVVSASAPLAGKVSLQITDMLGREIYSATTTMQDSELNINVAALNGGLYTLTLTTEGNRWIKKFFKQ